MKAWRLLPLPGFVRPEGDRLARVMQVLGARDRAALAEVEGSLAILDKDGPEAFARHLARPLPAVDLERDPVGSAWSMLEKLMAVFEALPPPARPGIAAKMLTGLKSIAAMEAARKPEEAPDAVEARIVAVRDEAVARILPELPARLAKYQTDRAALDAWAVEVVGHHLAGELGRRLDAMLGGAPS